jgi:death on curing protein
MIKFLTLEQVLRLHDAMIDKFGGLKGIRDSNLLASALEMPKATMFGEDLHPTIYDKAAAYLFHIVQNHPFNDGNKRTGAGSAYLFLRVNKVRIIFESTFEDETFEDFVVEVSKGKKNKKDISQFLEQGL